MKRLIIIGAGNSIRPELQNGLWDKLKKEYTFSLNDTLYLFQPTVPIFVDWYWYKARYEIIKDISLSIGKYDRKYWASHPEIKIPNISPNTIFLKPSNEYHGIESWEKGFYSGILCGCYALTLGIALGFKEIYLLGYDFTEINGKTHFYEKDDLNNQEIGIIKEKNGTIRCGIGKDSRGYYRTGVYNNSSNNYFNVYKKSLKETKIYNVSQNSKITTFPKISYTDFYKNLSSEKIDIDQELGREQIRQIITNKLGKQK